MARNEDYDIIKAFAAIEDELIASMIRNMKNHKVEEMNEEKQWTMWQAEQLKYLEQYRRNNQKKFGNDFKEINKKIESLIRIAEEEGEMEQEIEILKAIENGFQGKKMAETTAEFFHLNERKLDTLIEAVTNDMEKAEVAVLRMANDQYRKTIFNAMIYANTGAGTYEKVVDMATKDFLAAGLNCVEYANGARHTLSDYADMAIKTGTKRAYLQGEGKKRQEWGISTVIMNKRGNPCPKCLPFCGKVLIDDVWSGGNAEDGPYPLMSYAVSKGLYHPRCRDAHTTYFVGISTADDKWTEEELQAIGLKNKQEAEKQYANRQVKKYERLEKYSLDSENKKKYKIKKNLWKKQMHFSEFTKEEKGAVIRYVSPDAYVLNDKLRRNEALTDFEKDWIINLDKALEKLPNYRGNLIRSVIFFCDEDAKEIFDEFIVGKEFISNQYFSATKQGIYDENAQVQIYIQNSKNGKDLKGLNDMEHEVLYPMGSKFKVVNKVEVDGKYYILLEEI